MTQRFAWSVAHGAGEARYGVTIWLAAGFSLAALAVVALSRRLTFP